MGELRPRRRRQVRRGLLGGLIVGATVLTSSCGVLPALGPALPPEAAVSTAAPSPAKALVTSGTPGAAGTSGTSVTASPTATGMFGDTYADIDADAATISRWESSVLRIRSVTCTGTYTGSGFVIDAHTIVTNQHVVRGASQIQVDTVDGRDIAVKDVSQASDIDLAVIHTDATLPTPLPLAKDDAVVGQHVAVIGYPLGGPIATTKGKVNQWFLDTQLKGGLAMSTDATVEHGNSGGPVLDRHGTVVAVVYSKWDNGAGGAIGVTVLNGHLATATGFASKVTCDTP